MKEKKNSKKPPKIFRPLLWSLRWKDIDVEEDKEDIIVNAVNEGTLTHWRWLVKTYGKKQIREVLKKRLVTEFHPESLRLAQVLFHVPKLRYAR